MKLRPLGHSDLAIAPLVLGGNVFGWTVDETTAFRVLDAFIDAGFNMLDTADSYPQWAPGCEGGESEAMIGKWLKQSGKRAQVLIATKSGQWDRNPGLSPAAIKKAVDGALQRLQVERIDLFQAHAFDPDVPQAETLGAFAELIAAGKLRAIGASNFSVTELEGALAASRKHGLPRYECVQPLYNLMDRGGYERHLAPLVARQELGVISWWGLASGFLTGKYRKHEDLAKHARGSAVAKYLNRKGLRVLDALDQVAGAHAATPAQVALAWTMARPGISAPIASATSVEQVRDLAGAAALTLTDADMQALDKASG